MHDHALDHLEEHDEITHIFPSAAADVPAQIQELVADMLDTSKEQLRLLPQSMLDTAVFERFVGKEEKDAIHKQVDAWLAQPQPWPQPLIPDPSP